MVTELKYRVENQEFRLKLNKAAELLKAVSHPVRLAIIDLLNIENSLSVNEICEILGCEQSLISHHLINMKLRGILHSTKDGLNMYYTLKEKNILKVLDCIESCDYMK